MPISTKTSTVVTVTEDQRKQAITSGRLIAQIQKLYSLALLDLSTGETLRIPGLSPVASTGDNATYFFTVPPKVLEVAEPFATTIVNTQGGGKFIESHGSILKEFKVQGTTGLRPNKAAAALSIPFFDSTRAADTARNVGTLAGVIPVGQGSSTDKDNILKTEVTGFDSLVHLKNIFRAYSDIKGGNDLAGVPSRNVVMAWYNSKDGEYWLVEPMDFRVTQNSSSPMTYEYNITMKALVPLAHTFSSIEDPMETLRGEGRSLFSRLRGYSQDITDFFLTISTLINRTAGLAVSITDTILRPALSLLRGISAIKVSKEKFSPTVKRNARSLIDEIKVAADELSNSDQFDDQDVMLNAMYRMVITCSHILAEPEIREASDSTGLTEQRSRLVDAYNRRGTVNLASRAPNTGGSDTFIGNQPVASSVVRDTVHVGEDIRSLAARLLGDRNQWHTLVLLNDLRAPYISTTSGTNLLAPGDEVLYPGSAADTAMINTASTNNQAEDYLASAYGRDLLLTSEEASGGTDLTDISVNSRGDLTTVIGLDNVDQAIKIKFSTEQGELTVHPTFGTRFPIGNKATEGSFTSFRVNALATFASDPRISAVERLEFVSSGDVLAVKANLQLADSKQSLNMSFVVRRM